MCDDPVSLRERQRLAVWRSIHEAAAALTLDAGLAAVTVDAIVERAGVSRRTFFNYFPGKEDAVLGMRAPQLDAEEVRAYQRDCAREPAFDRTMSLLIRIVEGTFFETGHGDRRRELIAAEPALKERYTANIAAAEQLVLTHLESRGEGDGADEEAGWLDEHPESARALLMLAGTIIRYAAITQPDALIRDRSATLRSATAIFREVIERTL